MFNQLDQFLDAVGSTGNICALVDAYARGKETDHLRLQESSFQLQCNTFCQRLCDESYASFCDVLWPLIVAVREACFGLRLARAAVVTSEKTLGMCL